jgi:ubiquitin-protein ligase
MLTEIRWQKEQELMQSVFPEFAPFTEAERFGFQGYIKGHKSGNRYHVILQADQTTYPQWPPSVSMNPRIGMYWIGPDDRRILCMQKEWRPARSTFANTLLGVIRYLDEFDPQPGSAAQSDGPGGEDRFPAYDVPEIAAGLRRRFY